MVSMQPTSKSLTTLSLESLFSIAVLRSL